MKYAAVLYLYVCYINIIHVAKLCHCIEIYLLRVSEPSFEVTQDALELSGLPFYFITQHPVQLRDHVNPIAKKSPHYHIIL